MLPKVYAGHGKRNRVAEIRSHANKEIMSHHNDNEQWLQDEMGKKGIEGAGIDARAEHESGTIV